MSKIYPDDNDTDSMVDEMANQIPKNLQTFVLRLYSELSYYRGLSRGLETGAQWLRPTNEQQDETP